MATEFENRTYSRGAGNALVVSPAWQFQYRGINLNERDQIERYHVEDVGGFEDPDLRLAAEELPQQHGEQPLPSFYGGRTMTLSGRIKAGNLDRLDDMEQALREALMRLDESPLTLSRPRPDHIVENLVPNPSFENRYSLTGRQPLDGWFASASSIGGISWWSTSGIAATVWMADAPGDNLRVDEVNNGIPVVTGTNYTASFDVYVYPDLPNTGSFRPVIYWWTNGNVFVSATPGSTVPGGSLGQELTLSVTGTAPVGADKATPGIAQVGAGNIYLPVDSAMFVEGSDAVEYFDGDSFGYEWTGDPHFSTSVKSYPPTVQIDCRKADKLSVSKQITQDRTYERPFQVALRASDPTYRSVDETVSESQVEVVDQMGREYPRGYDLTYEIPMDGQYNPAEAGSNTFTIDNGGNWDAFPRIAFSGQMSNVVLRNETNGLVTKITDVPFGEVYLLDVKEGTLTDADGVNVFAAFDETSDWMTVAPGTNTFSVTVSNFSGDASVEVAIWDTWL